MIGLSGPTIAQSALAVPHFGKIVDVPGAQERPDSKIEYRVVFGVTKAAPKRDQANPSLERVARFVNLLTHYGVGRDNIHVVAIISGPATAIVRKPDGGASQPIDAALIGELTSAGVRVAVCSQAASAHGIAATDLLPGVHLDVSAITTIATLQAKGYGYQPD
ncbi:MAG: hypothetical protein DI605_09365 [Sphingomonas sp.]|nr:MAG: hypothetical protein DI605_09365 [Sphingomonas sp.]